MSLCLQKSALIQPKTTLKKSRVLSLLFFFLPSRAEYSINKAGSPVVCGPDLIGARQLDEINDCVGFFTREVNEIQGLQYKSIQILKLLTMHCTTQDVFLNTAENGP